MSKDGKSGFLLIRSPSEPNAYSLGKVDLNSGLSFRDVDLTPWGPVSLALSADGRTVYVLGSSLLTIDTTSLAITGTYSLGLSYISVTPDGQYIYGSIPAPYPLQGTVGILSTATFQVVSQIPANTAVGRPLIYDAP